MKAVISVRAAAAKLLRLVGSGRPFTTFSRGSLLIALTVVLLGGMGAAQYWQQNAKQHRAASQQSEGHQGSKDSTASTKSQAGTPPTDNQQPATSSNTSPAASTPSSPKTLIITPNSFTVKPGENLNLTIKASDGRAINYPHFTSSTGGNFLFNFSAAPAKTTWSGPILVFQNTPVGTYTFEIAAQPNGGAVTYRGSITVNVVKPTMNITIESHGYDAENDGLGYLVKINRLYGFNEPVADDGVAAYSESEPGLACYYVEIDANNIALGCGHDDASGPRPTSGTLVISISTASITKTVSISYNLPPLGQ